MELRRNKGTQTPTEATFSTSNLTARVLRRRRPSARPFSKITPSRQKSLVLPTKIQISSGLSRIMLALCRPQPLDLPPETRRDSRILSKAQYSTPLPLLSLSKEPSIPSTAMSSGIPLLRTLVVNASVALTQAQKICSEMQKRSSLSLHKTEWSRPPNRRLSLENHLQSVQMT